MARKVQVKPRKSPVQGRSRATVEAILEAAARVLVQDGYDRLSTNRVAATAGFSIGSLYQYFPSKEAIVAALAERTFDNELELIARRLNTVVGATTDQAVRELIDAIVESHGLDPKLRGAIIAQVPRVGALNKKLDVEDQVARLVELVLDQRGQEVRPVDHDMAAFILVHSVEAAIHAAVAKRPEYLRSDAFRDELATLVLGYLAKRDEA